MNDSESASVRRIRIASTDEGVVDDLLECGSVDASGHCEGRRGSVTRWPLRRVARLRGERFEAGSGASSRTHPRLGSSVAWRENSPRNLAVTEWPE